MKALPATCPRELAARRLVGRWPRLWPWGARNAAAPRIELVYLREFAVHVQAVGKGRALDGWLTVNVEGGSLSALEGTPAWEAMCDERILGGEPSAEAAARLFRPQIRRSRFRRGAWLLEPVAHPYWVYYVPRAGDRLDVRLLDAVSGRPVALRLKLAFLAALLTQRRPKSPTTIPTHLQPTA